MLAERYPQWRFFIISGAPQFLFRQALALPNVHLRSHAVDFGMVQRDPRTIDFEETARRLEHLLSDFGLMLDKEEVFLARECIAAVLCDVPFLPFEAAAKLGLPSIGMGNFSWDWIYYYYCDRDTVFERAANLAANCYRKCGLYLALPSSPPAHTFRRVKPISLVCRRPGGNRAAIRERLSLDRETRVALIGFSDLQLEPRALQRIEKIRDWIFLTPSPLELPLANGRAVNTGHIPFADLVQASDAVVTKPGYGIVSDAIACGIPLLTTERDDFPEVQFLQDLIVNSVGGECIDRDEFQAGKWEKKLRSLRARPHDLALDGAEQAVACISSFLDAET